MHDQQRSKRVKPSRKQTPSNGDGLSSVLHVEIVMKNVLTGIDIQDLDRFLSVCCAMRGFRWCFQEAELWTDLMQLHFGGREPTDTVSDDEDQGQVQPDCALSDSASIRMAEIPWLQDGAEVCAEVLEYSRCANALRQFQERVLVVRGDIGTIVEVGGKRIDALAFPTHPFLNNPHTGAARFIFRRAGAQLDAHIEELTDVILQIGEAYVTPGFDAGVRVLIHCHGPSAGDPQCLARLGSTYKSVLQAAKEENVACLAMTSISTGNFGVPAADGARVGMSAIAKFLRFSAWEGSVAVVCFETDLLYAFREERQRVLEAFNCLSIY
ncbi:hypothetical protein PINS_up005832 [Pythium insidiosum]|nr:hypothetical protein PINS_up005832 [Pythium insidiosum]